MMYFHCASLIMVLRCMYAAATLQAGPACWCCYRPGASKMSLTANLPVLSRTDGSCAGRRVNASPTLGRVCSHLQHNHADPTSQQLLLLAVDAPALKIAVQLHRKITTPLQWWRWTARARSLQAHQQTASTTRQALLQLSTRVLYCCNNGAFYMFARSK